MPRGGQTARMRSRVCILHHAAGLLHSLSTLREHAENSERMFGSPVNIEPRIFEAPVKLDEYDVLVHLHKVAAL